MDDDKPFQCHNYGRTRIVNNSSGSVYSRSMEVHYHSHHDLPEESGVVDAFAVILFLMVILWYCTGISAVVRKENELLIAFGATDLIGVLLVSIYNYNREIMESIQLFHTLTYSSITTFLAVAIVFFMSFPKLQNLHSIVE